MVKIVRFIIRGEDEIQLDNSSPRFLDGKMLNQPAAAMYLISQELNHLAELTTNMMSMLQGVISGKKDDNKAFPMEQEGVKSLQQQISQYITNLFSQGSLTEQQTEQTAGLLIVANHIDRIADRSNEIYAFTNHATSEGNVLSKTAQVEVGECISLNQTLFNDAMDAVRKGDKAAVETIASDRQRLHDMQKECFRKHFDRIQDNQCSPAFTTDYGSVLYALDRMADNCVSISEEAAGHAAFVKLDKPDDTGKAAAEKEGNA